MSEINFDVRFRSELIKAFKHNNYWFVNTGDDAQDGGAVWLCYDQEKFFALYEVVEHADEQA